MIPSDFNMSTGHTIPLKLNCFPINIRITYQSEFWWSETSIENTNTQNTKNIQNLFWKEVIDSRLFEIIVAQLEPIRKRYGAMGSPWRHPCTKGF